MENMSAGLTARQREMLEFERTWWQLDETREDMIRARFGCSSDEYYSELNQILELPEAMAHDPLVVRRFRRRRLRRRRSLFETNSHHRSSQHPSDGPLGSPSGQADRQPVEQQQYEPQHQPQYEPQHRQGEAKA